RSPEPGPRLAEPAGCPPEPRSKRERKHRSFTLCEVCNIQLNSAAQAQIHYNGKSHQKRLKQLNKGKGPAAQGKRSPAAAAPGRTVRPSGHSSPLLASLPIPGRPLHPPLDIKHFLTFRLNGTSPLNLFPNFNTMDPVQKAVISHTFGVPAPLKKKQFISCNICHLRFNSAVSGGATRWGPGRRGSRAGRAAVPSTEAAPGAAGARGRFAAPAGSALPSARGCPGSRSPQRLLARGPERSRSCCILRGGSDAASVASSAVPGAEVQAAEPGGSAASAPDGGEKEGKKSKQHLYCPTCKVTVNSLSQLEAHNTG
ncbi:Z385B protein, partial [Casuarius casuarius]|nr:Z385B protein [Casuarius casuarius]